MLRTSILAVAALATMAASPLKSGFSTLAVLDQSTVGDTTAPEQSGSPSDPADGYAPAPVPDADASAPEHESGPEKPELQANLFTPQKGYHGEGYLPGSTVQGNQDRKKEPAPGFSLKVPLE